MEFTADLEDWINHTNLVVFDCLLNKNVFKIHKIGNRIISEGLTNVLSLSKVLIIDGELSDYRIVIVYFEQYTEI